MPSEISQACEVSRDGALEIVPRSGRIWISKTGILGPYTVQGPPIYTTNGHVVAMTLAVIDVPKDDEKGNDGHGSKVIVIPFEGSALDRDLQQHS